MTIEFGLIFLAVVAVIIIGIYFTLKRVVDRANKILKERGSNPSESKPKSTFLS